MMPRASALSGHRRDDLRSPSSDPLANSTARFVFVIRGGGTPRIVELGDRKVFALGILTLLLLAWYLFATLYLVLRDDVVVSLVTGQRKVHYAYEDRIVELRARIDRITAKQLQNQETIEDRVAGLVARQAELEARAVMMADLSARAEKAGLAGKPRLQEPPSAAVCRSFSRCRPCRWAALPCLSPRPPSAVPNRCRLIRNRWRLCGPAIASRAARWMAW